MMVETLLAIPGIDVLMAVGTALGIATAFWGISLVRAPDPIKNRLGSFSPRVRSLEEIELSASTRERVVAPFFRWVASQVTRRTPQAQYAEIKRKLTLAGNPNNLDPTDFLGIKGCVALGFALLTFFAVVRTENPMATILLPLVFAGVGFNLPAFWLGAKIRSRKKEIQKALPDALDLLTISVEAGCGFDQAMQKVVQKWRNALALEFDRVLAEVRMGRARKDALRDMSGRIDLDDVGVFVSAIIQADQLGVSLTRVLRIQSEQMRIKRRQRAEELAQQAPIKMLFPMAFLIMPSLFVVVLGPAVPLVISVVGGSGALP